MVTAKTGRQGIGNRLVAVAVTEARAAGCEWLHVDFEDRCERLPRRLRLHTDGCRIDRPVARTAMSSDDGAFGLGIVQEVGLRPLLEFPAGGEGAQELIFKGALQRHGCTRTSELHDGEESFSRY